MEPQADRSSFRHYMYFFSGQQISLLGSSVAQFVIIWWIALETKSAWYLALASLAGFAPMILLTPFAGVLVDRWSRKPVIAAVDLAQAFSTVLLIFLFWLGPVSIWYVLIMLVFRSCCQAFHSPAVGAIVPLMVPRDKLSRINGFSFLATGVMTMIGPILGALLLALSKIEHVLWIDPATFAVAVLPLLFIKIPSVRSEKQKSRFTKDLVEGLAFIMNSRGLMPLVFLATVLNFLLMPMSTLLPYYVNFDHGGLEGDFALVSALAQAGMFLGGIAMTVLKEFSRKMLTATLFLLLCFLGYGMVVLTPPGVFWFMGACLFIMMFSVVPANVSFRTILQTAVPAQMQGRVNSVVMSLASAASPIGIVIAGTLVAYTGTSNLFLICATTGALVVLFSWFFTDMKRAEDIRPSEPSKTESSNPAKDAC